MILPLQSVMKAQEVPAATVQKRECPDRTGAFPIFCRDLTAFLLFLFLPAVQHFISCDGNAESADEE